MTESTEEFLDEINELLDNETYAFASPTLTGIRDTVAKTDHVTETQRAAIRNIRSSRDGSNSIPQWKRRYEGFKY